MDNNDQKAFAHYFYTFIELMDFNKTKYNFRKILWNNLHHQKTSKFEPFI